jgi:hypothetical protein
MSLLQIIDQRLMLLHRNLPSLVTVAESLKVMGEVDSLFYASLAQFLATQLPGVALSSSNTDLLLTLAQTFHEECKSLDAQFAEQLSLYLNRFLQTGEA